jgi:hypothetical protein
MNEEDGNQPMPGTPKEMGTVEEGRRSALDE